MSHLLGQYDLPFSKVDGFISTVVSLLFRIASKSVSRGTNAGRINLLHS